MTPAHPLPSPSSAVPSSGTNSRLASLRSSIQFLLALAVTLGVLGWLLFAPTTPEGPPAPRRATLQDSVQVVGPRLISIAAETPLEKKLQSVVAAKTSLNEPLFTVAGRVVASLRPGDGKGSDYWQFDAPEILTAFTDWQKAQADIVFAKKQLTGVEDLAAIRVSAQKNVVQQLTNLVAAGTDSKKDLAAAQVLLRQNELQGEKEVHEAQTALRIAERNEKALARQLQQAGLDPDMLRSATSDIDIVMAEVPEGRISQVQTGLGCEAKFFGIPDQLFHGKVNRVVRVLSKERHSLRVLFVIHDPKDQVRPGMFGEIGLGTDARQTILLSAEAVLHIGRSDYVLVHDGGTNWRVADVKVGELHGDRVEILDGSLEGQRILTKGTILLKPPAVLSLQPSASVMPNGGR
jgi:cobalt-zinc-cadmium efflux system membrane fusion protein